MSNTIPGISRFPCGVLLAQHRIEGIFLDEIRKHAEVSIRRNVVPVSMEIDLNQVQNHTAHAISAKLSEGAIESIESEPDGVDQAQDREQNCTNGKRIERCQETIRAKYVIGCDGAHSWTRTQLGFHMEGEQTEYIWGVLGMKPANRWCRRQIELTVYVTDIIPVTDFRRSRFSGHSIESDYSYE